MLDIKLNDAEWTMVEEAIKHYNTPYNTDILVEIYKKLRLQERALESAYHIIMGDNS